MEKVRSFEKLVESKVKSKEEFIKIMLSYLERFPDSKQWELIALKLSSIYMEGKDYQKALVWYNKINEREKSTESLYRVLFVKFQMEEFQYILDVSFNDKKPE